MLPFHTGASSLGSRLLQGQEGGPRAGQLHSTTFPRLHSKLSPALNNLPLQGHEAGPELANCWMTESVQPISQNLFGGSL